MTANREKPPRQMLMVLFTLDGLRADVVLRHDEQGVMRPGLTAQAGIGPEGSRPPAPSSPLEHHRQQVREAIRPLLPEYARPDAAIARSHAAMREQEPPAMEKSQAATRQISPDQGKEQERER